MFLPVPKGKSHQNRFSAHCPSCPKGKKVTKQLFGPLSFMFQRQNSHKSLFGLFSFMFQRQNSNQITFWHISFLFPRQKVTNIAFWYNFIPVPKAKKSLGAMKGTSTRSEAVLRPGPGPKIVVCKSILAPEGGPRSRCVQPARSSSL